MRKWIGVAGVLLVLTGAATSYANVNGTFEGNPIIQVQMDGQPIQAADVPAVNLNGRTMVPIYMLKALGVEAVWNGDNQTVQVSLPESEPIARPATKANVDKASLYKRIEDFGDELVVIDNELRLLNERIMLSPIKPVLPRGEQSRSITAALIEFNDVMDAARRVTQNYPGENDFVDPILNAYMDAIRNYSEAHTKLVGFLNGDLNDYIYDSHYDNRSTAGKRVSEAQEASRERYRHYIENALRE
ncbi:stalk domain-containing protein [Paenibacillus antri]|uniref:stalk domain-containing protein n=1 Tax=Paenibacillus antri TaxID=2582848 RepID=UPI0013050830|nr:stalk domain-containing protein [Paenibacillus antri]